MKVVSLEPSYGPAKTWTEAMMDCKAANKPGYLFGDINLHNAASACSQPFMSNYFPLRWIGVARQVYINMDDGKRFYFHIYHIDVSLKETL